MKRSIFIFIFAAYIASMYVVSFQIQQASRAFDDSSVEPQSSQNNPNSTNTTRDNINLRKRAPETQRMRYNETNCICSRIYDPVCASNDKSYFNLCQFECSMANNNNTGVRVLYQGNCIPF